jgi:hypothetical protein
LILLSSAGNDTTKQTTSHTMLALANNPAQRDWLMEDFEGRITWAVEEFVRWSSPVLQFARFATEDTEIAGQEIKAGDKPGCSTARRTGMRASSPNHTPSTCSAHRTRTWALEVAVRTSASATSLPRPSYETCSVSC